ncbi:hypothetical protein NL676_002735 [Syzygium grande]|nr:hypothetical protein NL676_002735 [Syzygium grande]
MLGCWSRQPWTIDATSWGNINWVLKLYEKFSNVGGVARILWLPTGFGTAAVATAGHGEVGLQRCNRGSEDAHLSSLPSGAMMSWVAAMSNRSYITELAATTAAMS